MNFIVYKLQWQRQVHSRQKHEGNWTAYARIFLYVTHNQSLWIWVDYQPQQWLIKYNKNTCLLHNKREYRKSRFTNTQHKEVVYESHNYISLS